MSNKQTQQAKIEQRQIPTQKIRLMNLVELSSLSLEQEILKEVEENPALEIAPDNSSADDMLEVSDHSEGLEDSPREDFDEDGVPSEVSAPLSDEEIFNEDYYSEEEMDDFMTERTLQRLNAPEKHIERDSVGVFQTSAQEQFILQLGQMEMTDLDRRIANFLVGSLDSDGYFTLDSQILVNDLLTYENIKTNASEVERILVQYVQQLDPPGTGARNLQECLLIQLHRQSDPTDITRYAIQIVENYFDLFAKRHFRDIENALGISDTTLQQAIKMIRSLDPKPVDSGSEFQDFGSSITPDFIISSSEGSLKLTLNDQHLPKVRFSKAFTQQLQNKKLMNQKEADANRFIRKYMDQGDLFVKTLDLRNKIVYNTMYAIMLHQKDYFLTGDDEQLKPMILKTIADEVDMDISTISRFSNSKYVQTDFGVIPVKHLFSESVNDSDVSSKRVKSVLKSLVDAEDKRKPLSDEALCAALKEKDLTVARRTVAKYREQLNIPPARLRKELN
ncbi:MAG: RNA polymerase factor sigma-54 [Bacteroidales bacterium]|nr:RNA polymerase factor sigma-54 [Bacteroidales bacterium]